MRQRISLFIRSNGIYYILDRTTPKDIWRSTDKTIKSEAHKILVAYRKSRPAAPDPAPQPTGEIRLSEFEKEFMAYAKQNYAARSSVWLERLPVTSPLELPQILDFVLFLKFPPLAS